MQDGRKMDMGTHCSCYRYAPPLCIWDITTSNASYRLGFWDRTCEPKLALGLRWTLMAVQETS